MAKPKKSLEALDRFIHEDNLRQDSHERAKKHQLFFSVLGIVMLVIAMGMLIFGVLEARKFTDNGQWPSVSGRIVDTSLYRVSRRRAPDQYCVFATYSYTVGSRTYQHGWTSSDCSTQRSTTESRLAAYIGRSATIWYDPTNPDRALNAPVGSEWMWMIWSVNGFIFIIALVFLSLALRQAPEKRKLTRPTQ